MKHHNLEIGGENCIIFPNLFRALEKRIKYFYLKFKFKEIHRSSLITELSMITPRYIVVKEDVIIWHNCRIEGVEHYNDKWYTPTIILNKGVHIQQGVHITCADSIVIGENTCISAYTTITDINHPYDDINIPIEKQDLEVKRVNIGKDCKINNGAVILPGVNIGNHVCIGANTVVNRDIPDYSVVVGAPARIIKRFNSETQNWEKTDKDGKFLNK